MKLTKKTFAPYLLVEVIENSYNFAGSTITEFKTYVVNKVDDLDITTNTIEVVQPIGTELTTILLVKYGGSPRVLFQDTKGQIYQAFWLDFSKFVVIK